MIRTFIIIQGRPEEVETKLNNLKETSFVNVLSSCGIDGLLVLTTVVTPLNNKQKPETNE